MRRQTAAAVALWSVTAFGCGQEQPERRGDQTEKSVLIDDAQSLDELVAGSALIVVGRPTGPVEERRVGAADTADFTQHVAVTRVLRGDAGSDIVVVRAGNATGTSPGVHGEERALLGPLEQVEQVLFLRPGGTPGTYSVVGHDQGDLPLKDGRVADAPFPELAGADVDEVVRIVAHSGAGHPEHSH